MSDDINGKAPDKAPISIDEIRAQNALQRTPSCLLHTFLVGATAADREVVRQAIRDRSVQCTAIARALRLRGFRGTHQVIQRHRTHGCTLCGLPAGGVVE